MKKRLYSVFVKVASRWVRISAHNFEKARAIRIFQDILLKGSCNGYNMALRPIKEGETINLDLLVEITYGRERVQQVRGS